MDHLPEALHAEVASFISLDYLRLRACSKAYCALLAKKRTIASVLREGDLRIFREWFGRPAGSKVMSDFRWACSCGFLIIAQWLVAHNRLTIEDVRSVDNYALRWACSTGSLATAVWLASYFNLTAADARSLDNWALRDACDRGHLNTAQWLVKHFKLTAADAKDCSSKGAATAAWLENFRTAARTGRVVES